MAISTQITRIKNNIANAYTIAENKNATLPVNKNVDNLAETINSIPQVESVNWYGASNETFFGKLTDGVLTFSEGTTDLSFNDVVSIADNAFYTVTYDIFRSNLSINSVAFPMLTTIGKRGLQSAFSKCTNLKTLYISNVTTIDEYGLSSAFSSCALTYVTFDSLTTLSANALDSAFTLNSLLTRVDFSALTTISDVDAFSSYGIVFSGCDALTEIHFKSNARSAIETLTGYTNKWGATNATIYFDL